MNSFHAVTEDTQNLLVQCSIKPGDVDSSRMTKEECEHVRGVFKEKSEQIAFIVKQQTDDGYCVDIKCVNDSILRKFKAQRKTNESWHDKLNDSICLYADDATFLATFLRRKCKLKINKKVQSGTGS